MAFNYSIRRSQRAKKTRIIVTHDKIEVVAPLKTPEDKIHAFVKSKKNWIITASDKINSSSQNTNKLAPTRYTDGVTVPFRGQQVKLRTKQSRLNKIQVDFIENEIIINLPSPLKEDNNSELIRITLINWMKKQAVGSAQYFVDLHGKKFNLYPRFIKIKTQKSRWGSCGIHNDINLNWLLILAPTEIMEYVVVHELCHIRERNHSAGFWRLVEAHLPDYQKHRNWLKKNGRNLMFGL